MDTHRRIMGQYLLAGDFVHEDTTDFEPAPEGEYDVPGILLMGEIGCRGRIVIAVRKFLEILERRSRDAIVETRFYRYNVSVRGVGNIFRYDNGHPGFLYPGHYDSHHKHVWDFQTGEELPHSPMWIDAHQWPLLNRVIDEAAAWRRNNLSILPDPDRFPELSVRG
jgi:hypothetical protein